MKRKYISIIGLALVFVLSFSVLAVRPSAADTKKAVSTAQTSAEPQRVLETRFLNMLNHNFVYGDAFESVEEIVNCSEIALLDKADAENDSFIREAYIRDYVYNMYGVEIDDFSAINADFPKLDGFVYIIPRGFSVYSHKIESVRQNEDGSYTVVTNVSVTSHDDGAQSAQATTLFVRNEKSAFGFNIISSDLTESSISL